MAPAWYSRPGIGLHLDDVLAASPGSGHAQTGEPQCREAACALSIARWSLLVGRYDAVPSEDMFRLDIKKLLLKCTGHSVARPLLANHPQIMMQLGKLQHELGANFYKRAQRQHQGKVERG